MAQKPSIPKGTRDFLPAEVAKRNYIFDTIRRSFETYGFSPIETPSFELSSTLLGKYGEEGDRLIFKILNSGAYLKKYSNFVIAYLKGVIRQTILEMYQEFKTGENANKRKQIVSILLSQETVDKITEELSVRLKKEFQSIYSEEFKEFFKNEIDIIQNDKYIKYDEILRIFDECSDCSPLEDEEIIKFIDERANFIYGKWMAKISTNLLTPHISEKALRYDLTVPFARFVVQHQNDLSFPFKRYQIQPVWRADRPQHGRYQEFYQCDADVVGSDSLIYEVDFVQLFDEVLFNLGIPDFTIKINNRKILSGIAEVSGETDKLIAITVAIDKLDKIGIDGVTKELLEKGISESALKRITPLFEIAGDTESRLSQMKAFLALSEVGLKGIEELEYVFKTVNELGLKRATIEFDVTLARGLNYYTGAIFEVKANGVNMGSICGGGRYDDLTGIFGMSDMSGVGISFGADRIYDVLTELDLFPPTVDNRLELLFINFGEEETKYCQKLVKETRAAGISSEIYPSDAKMKKQMKYANDRGVKNIALVGQDEISKGIIQLKNMESGEQTEVTLAELVNHLK